MILEPNSDFPYTHRLYFVAGLETHNSEQVLSQPCVYTSEDLALADLRLRQSVFAHGKTRSNPDQSLWWVQAADLLGAADHPQRGLMQQNYDDLYTGFISERSPNLFYPFAGGFQDTAHLHRWMPFVDAAYNMLLVASAGRTDENMPHKTARLLMSDRMANWQLLQFIPVSETLVPQAGEWD